MDNPPVEALAALATQSSAKKAQGAALLERARAGGLTTAQIDRAAEEFEAMFAAQMLQPMFKGLKSDGMFSGGHAEDTWRGFLVEALGDQIAKTGGLGIADAVRSALLDAAGPGVTPAVTPAVTPTVIPDAEA